ncbi:MAG: hypothetical protein JW874_15710 [Spirochaetales bacterium]|nr:hypothetical protein [Spirochaetales bacterium]
MKNKVLFISLIAVAILLYMFSGSAKKTVRPRNLGTQQYEALLAWVNGHHAEPEQYLLDLFSEKEIICLGTDHIIADGINFVNEITPDLPGKGVHTIAVDFLLADDQDGIDRLLSAPEFDETLARELLFNRIVIFGYREYVDMLRTVWRTNRDSSGDAEGIRIIGLAPYQDFSGIRTEEDLADNSKKLAVIADLDTVDSFMAKTALDRLSGTAGTDGKCLVFTALVHSFTVFHQIGYEQNAAAIGYPAGNTMRMGNYIYEKFGNRAATVFIHNFIPDETSPSGLNYPLGGIMEKVSRGLDNVNKRFAFSVAGSPFAEMEISGEFVKGYEKKTVLDDFCYGYIFLNQITRAETVTPIPHFINDTNLAEANRNFPGPKAQGYDANTLNSYISGIVARYRDVRKFFI